MYNLRNKAEQVKLRIAESELIGTVRYLDAIEQEESEPATFPAAFLVLEKLDGTNKVGTYPSGPCSWSVVVKGKSHEGDNLLPAIDSVIDLLDGFFPEGERGDCLRFGSVEFFSRDNGAVAYKITFNQTVYGRSRSQGN